MRRGGRVRHLSGPSGLSNWPWRSGLTLAVLALAAVPLPAQEVGEGTAATGLVGVTQVSRQSEVLIYLVELMDQDVTPFVSAELGLVGTNLGVKLTISDLTTATGLAPGDFSALRLYRSADALIGPADALVGTAATVNVGVPTEIDATGAGALRLIPDSGGSIFFLVTAVISPTATAGHAFRVGAGTLVVPAHIGIDETGIGESDGEVGSFVLANDAAHVVIAAEQAVALRGGEVTIPFGGEIWILALLVLSSLYYIRKRLGAPTP